MLQSYRYEIFQGIVVNAVVHFFSDMFEVSRYTKRGKFVDQNGEGVQNALYAFNEFDAGCAGHGVAHYNGFLGVFVGCPVTILTPSGSMITSISMPSRVPETPLPARRQSHS
ncbi:MAG: hypothetical protein JWQ55_6855 [Rhodopila sp.]|nr:hypothetical protein [Rhodopila sp.]